MDIYNYKLIIKCLIILYYYLIHITILGLIAQSPNCVGKIIICTSFLLDIFLIFYKYYISSNVQFSCFNVILFTFVCYS